MPAVNDASRPGPGVPVLTRERLVRDLRRLGVEAGQTLLVHASLSSVGWVDGGADTVVGALREAVGDDGNVVVPAGTEANSMTSRAHRERIADMTADEVRQYREEMPAFDRDATPGGAGAIAEALRKSEGAVRSAHPQSSFAAIGPAAKYLMAGHQLESHHGEGSPLAKLYQMDDARVLMIGVGYHCCTAFHLAEYRYRANPPERTYACVVSVNGERRWTHYYDVALDDREFKDIGNDLAAAHAIEPGYVGNAECRLMSLPNAVNFAVKWMAIHRK
jgi:aminoglycoside 3-N-acetyltransferase